MEEFKPNSHKSREENADSSDNSVKKVTTGKTRIKKKNGLIKFADSMISEDAANVKSYILMDVLLPAIKKAVVDIVTDGVNMILYGETSVSSRKSSGSKVSYRKFYEDDRRDSRSEQKRRYDYDEVVFDSRRDAEEVLASMEDLVDRYKVVSVMDFYELADQKSVYTDRYYGWTNLRSAEVIRVRDGYTIKLPKPLPID
jgi:hypothetical protein